MMEAALGGAVSSATVKGPPGLLTGAKSASPGKLEDDMMYGVTVSASHIKVRMGFVRKVYGIVFAQLLLTAVVGAYCMMDPAAKAFVQSSKMLYHASFYVSIGLLIGLIAKRKESPTNMMLLAAFTLCEAYAVGTIISFYDSAAVLQAAGLCTVITGGLTLFTFQTKYDFTPLNGLLVSALWAMIGVAIVSYFLPFVAPPVMLYSGCGAVLFSMFIVVDTQKLLKKMSTDEYILCAIELYLDIINLFLYILRILGERK